MELTNHAYERYCERILNISENDIKKYLEENKEDVKNSFIELLNKSIFLFKGAYCENNIVNYYVVDNFIIVVNESNEAIITLYKINFGLGEDINKIVTNELIKKINILKEKEQEETKNKEKEISEIEMDIDRIDLDIEKLTNEIELLNKNKNILKTKKEVAEYTIEMFKKDIESKCRKIIYNINYKMDSLAKKK
jgi:predicted transcriptional regulator